jgi:hypothetical protein
MEVVNSFVKPGFFSGGVESALLVEAAHGIN